VQQAGFLQEHAQSVLVLFLTFSTKLFDFVFKSKKMINENQNLTFIIAFTIHDI